MYTKTISASLYYLLFALTLHICCHAPSEETADLFTSKDFTAENLFSNNIEGPAFDKKGHLYVVNFRHDGTLGKVNADGKAELFLTLPRGSTANSIQFDSRGTMYLADYTGHNILAVDMTTNAVAAFVHSDAFHQPNDLCINRRDQLFASDPDWKESTGQIWRIDPDSNLVLLQDSMGTTNGIELSPDERILYVNESVQRRIWAFDVDTDGNISHKRLFAQFPDYGLDGMKCDKAGNLYVTRYDKGTVAILSPDGSQLREVSLRGKKCSNLVFGGSDGRTVYVTMQDRKGIEMFRTDIPGK